METFGHIVERFLIHLFSDPGIVLAVSFFLRFAKKKKNYSWLPTGTRATLIWAALVVAIVVAGREAIDISNNGWVVKSYIDWFSHACGLGLGTWGLIRYHEWDHS